MAPPKKKPPPKSDPTTEKTLRELRDAQLAAAAKPPSPDDKNWKPVPLIQRGIYIPKDKRGFNAALYDSRLVMNESANAELILTLRIFFQRVDPTPRGGSQQIARDGWGKEYQLREISDQELSEFRKLVRQQANDTWRDICLVTPNDFTGFDWPKHAPFRQASNPNMAVEMDMNYVDTGRAVRPNVNCSLNCEFTERVKESHAIVKVLAVSSESTWSAKDFGSSVLMRKKGEPGTQYVGTWEISDTGVKSKHADQDPSFWGFNKEDIEQYMVPHETGHLLGLDHIGEAMKVNTCLAKEDSCSVDDTLAVIYGHYKTEPMWFARNIMGIGKVVHACNLPPWAAAMAQHTPVEAERWIPAGIQIPPRPIKDIPKEPYTLATSPYTGGFQEQNRY